MRTERNLTPRSYFRGPAHRREQKGTGQHTWERTEGFK